MKDPVLIKSNRYGMTLRFDPELPFDLLRERVHEKLHAFTHFFNHACMVVTFEGRTFTKEEEQAMAETIEESAGIQILCLTDTEDNTQETHTITDTPVSGRHLCRKIRDNISDDTAGEADDSGETIHTEHGLFYRGNLKGRAILEADKSIVIVGDIEAGASVICKGSVTVTGTIYGTVIAGAAGDYNAMIAAIDMKPELLRIGEIEVKPVIGGSYSWARLL